MVAGMTRIACQEGISQIKSRTWSGVPGCRRLQKGVLSHEEKDVLVEMA